MLKKIFIYSALFISSIATAADKGNSIAIVNVEKLKMESKAGKSIAQQIVDMQNKFQERITKIEKDFEAKKQDLDKQKAVLSKEAFAKKEADFNNKIVEARNEIKKEAGSMEQMQQTASVEFDTIAFEIIKTIVKENNYQQVFPAGYLIYFDPKSDITSQVMAGLDKQLDTITLKAPAAK
jgi:outer membrane protein